MLQPFLAVALPLHKRHAMVFCVDAFPVVSNAAVFIRQKLCKQSDLKTQLVF